MFRNPRVTSRPIRWSSRPSPGVVAGTVGLIRISWPHTPRSVCRRAGGNCGRSGRVACPSRLPNVSSPAARERRRRAGSAEGPAATRPGVPWGPSPEYPVLPARGPTPGGCKRPLERRGSSKTGLQPPRAPSEAWRRGVGFSEDREAARRIFAAYETRKDASTGRRQAETGPVNNDCV